MRRAAEGQVKLAPNAFGAAYNLACAQALSGSRSAALATLTRIARMGIPVDAAADADLASLVPSPELERVRSLAAKRSAPVHGSRDLLTLPESDFVLEDIAYDPTSQSLLGTSVRLGKVVRIAADGTVTDLVPPGARTPGPSTRSPWIECAACSG